MPYILKKKKRDNILKLEENAAEAIEPSDRPIRASLRKAITVVCWREVAEE